MAKFTIYSLIKTECGRSKYKILSARNGLIAKIRLVFFILLASIKDWNLPIEDYNDELNS